MDLMNSIAATATSLSAAQFQQNQSLSVMKKAMSSQELAAQEMMKMLPEPSVKAAGSHIDVYA